MGGKTVEDLLASEIERLVANSARCGAIRGHMPVIAADDRRVGFVARLEGADGLKITRVKNGHGFDHVIPLSWVSEIDRYVFLNKNSKFVRANWQTPFSFSHARAA